MPEPTKADLMAENESLREALAERDEGAPARDYDEGTTPYDDRDEEITRLRESLAAYESGSRVQPQPEPVERCEAENELGWVCGKEETHILMDGRDRDHSYINPDHEASRGGR